MLRLLPGHGKDDIMELNELLLKRRSCRKYAASAEITEDEILAVLSDTQQAASWANSQSGRYYVALSDEARKKVYDCLPPFNQGNTDGCSAYIIQTFVKGKAGFRDGVAANAPGNEWGAYDLGLATSYLMLSATDRGYATLIMGVKDDDAIREQFGIPEDEELMAVLSIGKAAAELKFNGRKDLTEISKIC